MEEGRLNILTAGERRFETEEVTQRTPHLEGRIRFLEEAPGEPSEETMAEFREEFGAYLKNLSSLAGGWTSQAPIPQDLVTLSYSAASSLDIPLHVRQTLLESATAGEAAGTPAAHAQAGQQGPGAGGGQAQPLPGAAA